MTEESRQPLHRAGLFECAAVGLTLGGLAARFLDDAAELPGLLVQLVGSVLMFVASLVLLVRVVGFRRRMRDHVRVASARLLAGEPPGPVPARVRTRGIAGNHPGFLAGARDPQDTSAVFVLLDVATAEGRRGAGALVPRKVGLGLRRRQVVGVVPDPDVPDVVVLDLRVSPQQLEAYADDPAWQHLRPDTSRAGSYLLALLGGFLPGLVLAYGVSPLL